MMLPVILQLCEEFTRSFLKKKKTKCMSIYKPCRNPPVLWVSWFQRGCLQLQAVRSGNHWGYSEEACSVLDNFLLNATLWGVDSARSALRSGKSGRNLKKKRIKIISYPWLLRVVCASDQYGTIILQKEVILTITS